MAFVRDTGIRNLVALTGDIHAFFAGPVMDDYDAAMPKPIMVDLVTAGISSNSFFSYFKNVVDNDPAFAQAKPLIYSEKNGALTNTFNATLKQFNGGWLRHVDTDAQGFAVVTLTPAELRCVFSKLAAQRQAGTRATGGGVADDADGGGGDAGGECGV